MRYKLSVYIDKVGTQEKGRKMQRVNLTNILIQDKVAEMRETLEWLEDYGIISRKDIANLQRLLDTLGKLVEIDEREALELAEACEEGQGDNS